MEYVENKNMTELTMLLNDMALEGYGVAWHEEHDEYRPFSVEKDVIEWWADPEGCGHPVFETAVRATHEEMLRQLGP